VETRRFIGVWQLESWSARLPDGRSAFPFGAAPHGTLVYNADGTMISTTMGRERAPIGLSLEELAAYRRQWLGLEPMAAESAKAKERFFKAALLFNAYAGRFSLDGARVHHYVEIALLPDWVGKRLTRRYTFEGSRLTLEAEAPGQQDTLVWKRR
jgi:hypothetical protein